MWEQEGLPAQDFGPLQYDDEGEIVRGVEAYLQDIAIDPVDGLPEPPPNLIRRFWIAKPSAAAGEYDIPLIDLPDELAARAIDANQMSCELTYHHSFTYDVDTDITTMTPQDVLVLLNKPPETVDLDTQGDFDLHDVYSCMEARLLREIEKRKRHDPDNQHLSWYECQLMSALKVVGEVIDEELG
jgi:hypothetical protein